MSSKSLKLRGFAIFLVAVWAIFYLLPNFIDTSKYKFLPSTKLIYGLDIQGGIYLVMGVDVNEVVTESLRRTGSSVRDLLTEKGVVTNSSDVSGVGETTELYIELKDVADIEKSNKIITDFYTNLQFLRADGSKISFKFYDNYVETLKKNTVEQSIETIRNRIDEFGVSEPSITAQGNDRILIQLPGIKDSSRAKELVNRTAKLEFMIVARDVDMTKISDEIQKAEEKGKFSLENTKYSEYVKRINQDLAGILPKNTKLLFAKPENAETMAAAKIPYVLEIGLSLTGEDLKTAHTGYGDYGDPNVSLTFNPAGANKFADITGKNVGRQMAIILDEVVYSAPNIRERIGGGSAQITLGSSRNHEAQLKEANTISMALRAGALPARLEQLEERTVGPTLGADSIEAAKKAVVYGLILISLFMVFYYKSMGLISIVALTANGLLVLAGLTSLNATLTLPGIAGIGLTLGMAIDANVIIYERIREELRKGVDFVTAMKEGFNRASTSIIDANLTTAATSAILMYFGTGPIRGFGTTLLIGIVTTLFSAVFLTQVITEFLVYKIKIKKLSI